MTKLVLKTVAITLVAVLGACLITFGSLALFAPVSLARMFDGLGMYKSSIHYYEKQYGKSESIEDLAVLVLKIDNEKDSVKAEKYLEIMVQHPDYSTYCETASEDDAFSNLSLSEFYNAKYAVALVKNSAETPEKFNSAIQFANAIAHFGYNENNPFSAIISELGGSLSEEQLLALKSEILEYLDDGQNQIAKSDINTIDQLLDNN